MYGHISKLELDHALRYAEEATKVFLFDWSKTNFPDIFEHAKIEIRPATSKDYYIPSSIADKCIVVTETSFDEKACLLLACFPFKENLQKCEKSDRVQWVPLGQQHILACQPACFTSQTTVDAEWRNGKCVQVNPFKKMFAMLPERHLGLKSKQPFQDGLDFEEGKLKLNRKYCEAFGLSFVRGNCQPHEGQDFLEILFGKTIYRKILTKNVNVSKPSKPASVPDAFNNLPKKQNQPTDDLTVPDISEPKSDSVSNLAAEIAKELAADIGMDISLSILERLLKKQGPKLLKKATSKLVIKSVLIHSIVRISTSMAIASLKAMGKMVGGFTSLLAIYDLVAMVLDVMDPYNYDKVLDLKKLKDIDHQLDLQYYSREDNFDKEVTPEFLWDIVYSSNLES
ncbi:Per os infectivity factor 0 like protein, partial [Argiope bruennichi]